MRAALLVLTLLTWSATALRSTPSGAADLKLATWNLEWLTLRPAGDPALPENVAPKRADDLARLRQYAVRLDADVVAFQEVDGAEAAAEVFPADRYALAVTGDRVVQRVGFAVRRGLAFERNPDLVSLDVTPDAVHRLRSGADITLLPEGGGGGARLRLLSVHLKSGCQRLPIHPRSIQVGGGACELLARQVPPLQGWIAQRREEGAPFVILGDFNRVMDGAARDPLLAELQRAAGTLLIRATEGKASPCWGGGAFIDHILAGGAAGAWLRPDTLRVLTYREQEPEWKERLSDHCPVSVRFLLPGIPLR